jgi:DNA-directed RNA polymerase specialized sigma24 family protein
VTVAPVPLGMPGAALAMFEARLVPFRPQVQRHLRAMVRDDAEAEELTQDTYARAFERIGQLRDPQAALAWLYRIATTVALDRLRQKRPATVALSDDDAENAADGARPPSLLGSALERAEMSACVEGLSRRAARRLPDRDPAPRRPRPQLPATSRSALKEEWVCAEMATAAPVAAEGTARRILTPDQRLRVFISSTLQELAPERLAGHAIWWTVDAESEEDALRLLPSYVAKRTTVARVSEIDIP